MTLSVHLQAGMIKLLPLPNCLIFVRTSLMNSVVIYYRKLTNTVNINVVRLVSVGENTSLVDMCKGLWLSHFLNACTINLLSLAATHYCSSDDSTI